MNGRRTRARTGAVTGRRRRTGGDTLRPRAMIQRQAGARPPRQPQRQQQLRRLQGLGPLLLWTSSLRSNALWRWVGWGAVLCCAVLCGAVGLLAAASCREAFSQQSSSFACTFRRQLPAKQLPTQKGSVVLLGMPQQILVKDGSTLAALQATAPGVSSSAVGASLDVHGLFQAFPEAQRHQSLAERLAGSAENGGLAPVSVLHRTILCWSGLG